MARCIWALLVGINDYPPGVPKLAGCVNDVDHFQSWLAQQALGAGTLSIEVLKDSDATRAKLIALFRSHLGQAGPNDVALFMFCGHGARSVSSPAFRPFYPHGKDEGLVCFDSRLPGGRDLADKELAVLIAEVASTQAQLLVWLDCCHSGSGTRGVGTRSGMRPRFTHGVRAQRALPTYLDGHYARMLERGEPLCMPSGRHLLLAACDRGQLAQESAQPGGGVFTSALIDTLQDAGGALSYAELFARCRTRVSERVRNQTPQLESHDGFDAHAGFLGQALATARPGFAASAAGASLLPDTPLAVAIADDDDNNIRHALQSALDCDGRLAVHWVQAPEPASCTLTASANEVTLTHAGCPLPLCRLSRTALLPPRVPASLLSALRQVSKWERSLALQNPHTLLNPSRVDLVFAELRDGGAEHLHNIDQKAELRLACGGHSNSMPSTRGALKLRNRSGQTLHALLLHLTDRFGIIVLRNEPIPPGDAWVALTVGRPGDFLLKLPPGVDERVLEFKLMVATHHIDDFTLAQADWVFDTEPAGPGLARALNSVKPQRKPAEGMDWFTRSCCIRVLWQFH